MKRSGKFYRNNEKEVMKLLGLKPTKNSGSGWIEKEDGQSENIICQLKSTDAGSIKLNLKDIKTLEKNANITHKLPVFTIQFLQTNDIYLLVSPMLINEISKYLELKEYNAVLNDDVIIDVDNVVNIKTSKRKIMSSNKSRDSFRMERENKYKKIKSAK